MTKWDFKNQFLPELTAVCSNLGIPIDWLITIIGIESGYTYSPSATNSIGCVGLIQFCPGRGDVAVGSTTSELKRMSVPQQLLYVQKFFEVQKATFGMGWDSFADLYMTVFLPAYTSKPDSFEVSQQIANANPTLFPNKFDRTLGSLRARMNSFCSDCNNELPNSWGSGASINNIKSKSFFEIMLGLAALCSILYLLYQLQIRWKTQTFSKMFSP